MFLIRNAREDDLDSLMELAANLNSVNFPHQAPALKEQLALSQESFSGKIKGKTEGHYIFLAEDLTSSEILGASMIFARHGSPLAPHYYFQVFQQERYSHTLKKGFTHRILRLASDEDGPTELGGLIIHPRARGRGLGRSLSYIRLMYIGLHRQYFKEQILAELLPPLTDDGKSLLWEAYGNKFTALTYKEADYLSRKNKEFIAALFPKHDIYSCLFPPEVQEVIGEIGKDTISVKVMLEEAGFRYLDRIDPFDGGPHFGASVDEIKPIREIKMLKAERGEGDHPTNRRALVAVEKDSNFRAAVTPLQMEDGKIFIDSELMDILNIKPAEMVASMPLK